MNDAQLLINKELSGLYDEYELQSVSRLLLSHLTGLSFTGLILNKNTTFSDNQRQELKKMLALLKTGMPVQYVLGETEFCGLRFKVGEGVLIPRPETEELVEWAVDLLPQDAMVLDIGTGSGCIAIAIQHLRPDCRVWACDVSPETLAIADDNAKLLNSEVQFFKTDILKDELPVKPWNLIISNPPYIPRSESCELESRVKDFEPELALFVADDDPLLFYRVIAQKAKKVLKENGMLLFELHRSYAIECKALVEEYMYKNVSLKKDISGNDRMLLAQKIDQN